jgi:hypothetical protein
MEYSKNPDPIDIQQAANDILIGGKQGEYYKNREEIKRLRNDLKRSGSESEYLDTPEITALVNKNVQLFNEINSFLELIKM